MKNIIIASLLFLVIGIGFFVLNDSKPDAEVPAGSSPNPSPPAQDSFVISEDLAKTLVGNVLAGTQFNVQQATHATTNIDQLGQDELIIGAAESLSSTSNVRNSAAIIVVRPLTKEGQYEIIGQLDYEEHLRDIPQLRESIDITGDGTKELFASLGFGGASNEAFGLLHVDAQQKTVKWIQLRDQAGSVRDAIFLMGGTVTHTENMNIEDINNDGEEELVELFTQIWEPAPEEKDIPAKQEGEMWCLVRAYSWNGSLFDFNRNLSEQYLSQLNESCLQ